ncbi:transcription initiation factor IIA large subunit [Manihot esculenta]|uniref:Uncharacterized protein n=1 Tax=Manihot esculenta TaxID=3983 RepID=A0A2C9WLL5_MANES|nr:transcription initiation factor IIA large subunit [Manihot esculenta]OAY61177.1 hypothetical protein MANES_01G169400v8 [Manihot esculenta]
MATSSTTSTVYIHVIEDVINKVRDEFINNGGPGEGVLSELQAIWEMKMMQAGVICGPIDRSSAPKLAPGAPITPVHDLNVPYEGTEEYETPTAEMLFPPTPLQTPIQTPLPGSVQTPLPGSVQTPLPGSVDNSSMYNIPTGPTSEYPTPASDTGGSTEAKAGRPSPYMQPPSPWMNQRPPLDVNVAYVEGRDEADRGASHQPLTQDFFMMSSGKRKRDDFGAQYNNGGFIPQQDGAGDAPSVALQASQGYGSLGRHDMITNANIEILSHATRQAMRIPQLDGPIPDPYDDVLSTPNIYNYQGVVNEDYNIANTPAPNDLQASTPAVAPQNDAGDDDDDEPLNEDDDDDDDLDDVEQGEDMNTQHLVLAQFDKVTRTKSRWKCTLKDGIMHINNKDILFNKATGEFDF